MDQPATFHRPAREHPTPVPKERVRVAAPPTLPTPAHHGIMQTLFPVLGSIGFLGFALVYHNKTFLYLAIGMSVLMVGFSVLMRFSQKRGERKRAAEEYRRYASYLRRLDRQLGDAGELQKAALARLFPEPGRLWGLVLKRRGLWERRPSDSDFLQVRLGRGTVTLDQPTELDIGSNPLTEYQPRALHEAGRLVERRTKLRQQPVIVDLEGTGIVAVTGSRERARAWTRILLSQLATFRAPQDLRLLTCFDPADASDWEWGKWLPHQRADRNAPVDGGGTAAPGFLLARSDAELAALLEVELQPRLEQLRRLQESELHRTGVALVAPELVVVIDGYHPGHPANKLPLFREVMARPRELKVVLVLLVDARELEPSHIDARFAVPPRGPAAWERTGPDAPRIPDVFPDEIDVGASEALARALTPLRLEERGQGERSMTGNVRLLDLVGLPSATAYDPSTEQRPRPAAEQLRVPLGVQEDGSILQLDLKESSEEGMGPHGLLIGATGSGKSELLRTLVTSLAMRHDPDTLSFVLVDYKGGAAFAELSRLPHTAGLITNLQRDLTLVDRMREALVGEQERRQSMLRDAGNLDDCRAYRAAQETDPSLTPMPYLLVIVDEFAELLAARPDFIDLFVGLGRVGRSLGMHLLLSSQRLDQGRLRGLESHLRYRICLRTYSSAESKEVLGTPDAYLLPSLPGLGYLKVDTSVYSQFRTALVSTAHREPTLEEAEPLVAVRSFDAAAGGPTDGGEEAPRPTGDTQTDLKILVARLGEGRSAGPVHQVWVPPLPAAVPLDAVLDDPAWWSPEARAGARGAGGSLAVRLGTLDLPARQRTEPLELDFSAGGGHLAVVGAPQSGKSTLLRALLASFIWSHTPEEAQFYCLDLGGGLLRGFAEAPHVGGVMGKLDREAVRRVIRQLQAEIEEREVLFRRGALDSMADVRARRARGEPVDGLVPDLFLVVDGWAAFRRDFEDVDREVEDLAAAGLNYGVHVVVSANRWAEIRPSLLDNLGSRLELRLNDPVDSDISRAAAATVPEGVPGRGLTGSGLHFQAALPRVDGRADTEALAAGVQLLVDEAAAQWDGAPAPPVRVLPLGLPAARLPAPGTDAHPGVPIGVEELRLDPVYLDPLGEDPHFLVFGDGESGKTTFLRLFAEGLSARYGPDEAQLVLVDLRRALLALAEGPNVLAYAGTPPMVADAVERVGPILRERLPGPDASRAELLHGIQWTGPRIFVLIDDYDLVAGGPANPLSTLLDLLPHGSDIGLHVVLARRVGGSARGAYEPFFQRLRELSPPGLILSGDPLEGHLLGAQRATPQPPGRGVLVRRNLRPALVQVALPSTGVAGGEGSDPAQVEPGEDNA